MTRYLPLLGCTLLFSASVVADDAPSDDTAQAVQAERDAAVDPAPEERQAPPKRTPTEKLDSLELPDNPTRAQCQAFIRAIRVLINQPGSFKVLNDPAAKKLSSIPVEHIEMLVQIIANTRAATADRAMYLCATDALTMYEPESLRDAVVNGLAKNPSLILLIVQHGWYQAASDVILAKLENTDPFREDLPPIWLQAFVEVAEPEHYERLHQMTLNYRKLARKLSLLDTLEDYDFARTVKACWDNLTPELKSKGMVYINRDLRPLAIANGNLDAMAHAVEELTNLFQGIANSQYHSRGSNIITPEFLVRRHLDFRGTHAEIVAWFNANRDELIFDTFEQRFLLPEDF